MPPPPSERPHQHPQISLALFLLHEPDHSEGYRGIFWKGNPKP